MGSDKLAGALRCIARLARDRRGVSAIEFAMIAPVLILLYVGTVELGTALTVYRRTSQVAATAADLTAQVKTVTKSDIADIEAASSSILTPYSTTPLKIVLSSVVADRNNNGKVEWSCASSGSARSTGSILPGAHRAYRAGQQRDRRRGDLRIYQPARPHEHLRSRFLQHDPHVLFAAPAKHQGGEDGPWLLMRGRLRFCRIR